MDGWKVTAIVLIVIFVVVPLLFLVVGGVVVGTAAGVASRRIADGTDGGMS